MLCCVILVVTFLKGQTFLTEVDQNFPHFEVLDIYDNTVSNKSIHGKPTLLIFFGTRCPPCFKELSELHRKVPDDWYEKMNVIAVGSTDDTERLIHFKSTYGYKFQFIPDPKQELFNRVADYNIPRTFLLDEQGVIISQTVGYNEIPLADLLTKIESLIY